MNHSRVYSVIGMLALGLAANNQAAGQTSQGNEQWKEAQGGTVKGKIVLLEDYIAAVSESQQQIQQQRERGVDEQQKRLRERTEASALERNKPESRQERGHSDADENPQASQKRQSDKLQGQQERSRDADRFGNRQNPDHRDHERRFGQDRHAKQMVLITKQGGLFGSSERAYVLWFGPRSSGSEMTEQKAINLAQGTSSHFGTWRDRANEESRESARDRSDRQAGRQTESSQRENVRGESAAGQNEVSVTGKKIKKGGLNVLWVQSIESQHGSYEPAENGQKDFDGENDQENENDQD